MKTMLKLSVMQEFKKKKLHHR